MLMRPTRRPKLPISAGARGSGSITLKNSSESLEERCCSSRTGSRTPTGPLRLDELCGHAILLVGERSWSFEPFTLNLGLQCPGPHPGVRLPRGCRRSSPIDPPSRRCDPRCARGRCQSLGICRGSGSTTPEADTMGSVGSGRVSRAILRLGKRQRGQQCVTRITNSVTFPV